MTMYNRMARWYDMSEKWIGPLLHGKAIDKLRKDLMEEIEWKDNLSVLKNKCQFPLTLVSTFKLCCKIS